MNINAISTLFVSHNNTLNANLINNRKQNPAITENLKPETINKTAYISNISSPMMPKKIIFRGKVVHIVDGGIHATNMKYFAKYVKKDLDIQMHEVQINAKDRYTKQLKSLENQLKALNKRDNIAGEYVAIPALSPIPLLNLQEQYNKITCKNETFTPENIKSKKKEIISLLRKLYEYPSHYKDFIPKMDNIGQGIEYTYGVIREINKLVEKGAKVYVPSGHPNDATIKWLAGQRGIKPELYHYIATGEDVNSSVKGMLDEIKSKNWYTFNLLALSDANIVGLKDKTWQKDYIFAAYDSCVTDSARGTYNLSPLRKKEDGSIYGYSYSDKYTNDYPYEAFPMNKEVSNLLSYVGKNKKDVVASLTQTNDFLIALKNPAKLNNLPDMLYPVEWVFSEKEIAKDKIKLQGKYVDKSLKLFFDENKDGKIIFKKCDCEASGRPSVLSIWGSCYATFNVIARDINLSERYTSPHNQFVNRLNLANLYKVQGDSRSYEALTKEALNIEKILATEKEGSNDIRRAEPYINLASISKKRGDLDVALGCLNRALDILTEIFYKKTKPYSEMIQLVSDYEKYISYKSQTENYDREIKAYNNLSLLEKIFSSKPDKPSCYNEHVSYLKSKEPYEQYAKKIIDIYREIANICDIKGEQIPAKICRAIIYDLEHYRYRGEKALIRRAEHVHYVGDLYNEIK